MTVNLLLDYLTVFILSVVKIYHWKYRNCKIDVIYEFNFKLELIFLKNGKLMYYFFVFLFNMVNLRENFEPLSRGIFYSLLIIICY